MNHERLIRRKSPFTFACSREITNRLRESKASRGIHARNTARSPVLAFIGGTARCNYDKVNVRVSGGPAGSTLDRRGFWV